MNVCCCFGAWSNTISILEYYYWSCLQQWSKPIIIIKILLPAVCSQLYGNCCPPSMKVWQQTVIEVSGWLRKATRRRDIHINAALSGWSPTHLHISKAQAQRSANFSTVISSNRQIWWTMVVNYVAFILISRSCLLCGGETLSFLDLFAVVSFLNATFDGERSLPPATNDGSLLQTACLTSDSISPFKPRCCCHKPIPSYWLYHHHPTMALFIMLHIISLKRGPGPPHCLRNKGRSLFLRLRTWPFDKSN